MRFRYLRHRSVAGRDRLGPFGLAGPGTGRSVCRLLVSLLGVFGILSSLGPEPLTSIVQAGGPPMPVISRGVPAYASANGGAAGQANDSDYSTEWRSGTAPTA